MTLLSQYAILYTTKERGKRMKKLLLVIMIVAMAYVAGAYTTIVTQEVYASPTGYEVVAYGNVWSYE